MCAAVVILSSILALLPAIDTYAASFNASQLDPGVPLNALSHAQCRSNQYQVNFTFTTNSGRDIEVNAPWTNGQPTDDELRGSCTKAINSVLSQFGGAKISSDDGGYFDSALGQWQEFGLEPSSGQPSITNFLAVNSGTELLAGCIANQSTCELQMQSNLSIKDVGTLKLGPNSSGISGFSQTGNTGGLGGGNTLSLVKFTVSPSATRLEICVVASPSTCFSTDISNLVTEYAPEESDTSELSDTDAPAPECDLGAMGWAICPLMNAMDSMLGGIYSWVEENFLQIQVDFYNVDSGTYEAWTVFRNIANILFVIFFLIVIFSQVTNVGISNYGIKKMLPEIILAAVLINLSYFIAQAMIDVSNIVGFQIKSLLEFIASGIGAEAMGAMPEGSGFLAGLSSILLGVGAAAGGIAIGVVLTGGLGAFFAAVLLFLLSALIAVLMLFLLLVIRQVGVIILIVLAPLAFAARILPNTANLFKTWWKMFVSLLVVYPACGLVIGAGKLAARIIVSAAPAEEAVSVAVASILGPNAGIVAAIAARSMYLIVAMIAMIAPYFAVISIIKGSLNGLGKLGGAITGKVQGASRWGQNNINKAPGVRNLQRTVDAGRAARAAQLKAKAETANAKAAAKPNSAVSKMNRAKFESDQAQDDASMAALGQYQGDNKRLQKISAANAKRLGVNPDGTVIAGREAVAGSWEEAQQQAARTAVLQQEAKQAKQMDEQFDSMLAPGDVYNDVFDSSTTGSMSGVADTDASRLKLTGNASADSLRMERAIAALAKKGDIEKATNLTRAYTSSDLYKGISRNSAGAVTGTDTAATKHNQQRLSAALTNGDIKKSAAHLHAYGWQTGKALGQGNEEAFSIDQMASGTHSFTDSSGATQTTKQLGTVLHDKYDGSTIASQDKDTFKYLASSAAGGANFSSKQFASALSSGASQDKVTEMNSALASNAALGTQVANDMTSEQFSKIDDSTLLAMANQALVANGYGGAPIADIATLKGYVSSNPAAQTAMQGAFKEAYSQANVAGSHAADHWSSDRRSILGL